MSRRSKPAGSPKSARAARSFACTPRDLPSGERRLFAPIDDLRVDEKNARLHPPRQIEELRASWKRYGQQKPIVVNSKGRILAGHGFVEALRIEGEAEVWVVVSDLDELRSKAFAIADNRTHDLSTFDKALLGDVLSELGTMEPELVHATGFDRDEIAALMAELDAALEPQSAPAPRKSPMPIPDPAAHAIAHWKCPDCRRPFATAGEIKRAGPCPTCGKPIPTAELEALDRVLRQAHAAWAEQEAAAMAAATPAQLAALAEGRGAYKAQELANDGRRFKFKTSTTASPYTRGKLRTPPDQPTDPRHGFFVRGWRLEEHRERLEEPL